MFHQVDLIATPCYDWPTFDRYRSLTSAKMFGFFQYYPVYAYETSAAKRFLHPFLKQVDHGGIRDHLISSLVY